MSRRRVLSLVALVLGIGSLAMVTNPELALRAESSVVPATPEGNAELHAGAHLSMTLGFVGNTTDVRVLSRFATHNWKLPK